MNPPVNPRRSRPWGRWLILGLLASLAAFHFGRTVDTMIRHARGRTSIASDIWGAASRLAAIRRLGEMPVGWTWSGDALTGDPKAVITSVGGIPVRSVPEAYFRARLRTPAGDTLWLAGRRGGVEGRWPEVVSPFPSDAMTTMSLGRLRVRASLRASSIYLGILYGTPLLLLLLTGVGMGLARPRSLIAFQVACGFLGASVLLAPIFGSWAHDLPLTTTLLLAVISTMAGVAGLCLLIRALAVFPNRTRLGDRLLKHERLLAFLIALLLSLDLANNLGDVLQWKSGPLRILAASGAWNPLALLGLLFVALIIALVVAQRRTTRERPQARLRVIEAGFLLAAAGVLWSAAVIVVFSAVRVEPSSPAVGLFVYSLATLLPGSLALGLPIAFAYAVIARRAFGTGPILRRGLRALLLSRVVIALEGLVLFVLLQALVWRGQERLGGSLPAVTSLAATIALVVAFGLSRVNRPLFHRIDRRFFRESHDARRVLLDLGRHIPRLTERGQILERAGKVIQGTLHPSRLAIFLPQPSGSMALAWTGEMSPAPGEGNDPPLSVPDVGEAEVAACLDEWDATWIDLPATGEDDPAGSPASAPGGPAAPFELLVRLGEGRTTGCLALSSKLSEEPYSQEDKELLATVAAQMALALENTELLEVARREAEQSRELAIARQVQQNLFPQEIPRAAGWEFAACCRPARAVGGDYYDIFAPSPGRIVLALGDVSGKGVGPSLLMAGVHALIRNRLPNLTSNLPELAEEIHRHILHSSSPGMFLTLFAGVLDLETGRLRYVNAGHNPPLLLARGRSAPVWLSEAGVPLGILPVINCKEAEVFLQPDDLLVVYSDGVTEAINEQEELFEDDRLVAEAYRALDLPANEVVGRIIETLDAFAGSREQADDISILVVRRSPAAACS